MEGSKVPEVMEGYSSAQLRKFAKAYDAQKKIEEDGERRFYLVIYQYLCRVTLFIRLLRKRAKKN